MHVQRHAESKEFKQFKEVALKVKIFHFFILKHLIVLISHGTEFIFFLLAGTVLRFGFSMRIMLMFTDVLFVAKQCSLYVKDFPGSPGLPMRSSRESWKGAQPEQLIQTSQFQFSFPCHQGRIAVVSEQLRST